MGVRRQSASSQRPVFSNTPPPMSSSAKADDPVFQRQRCLSREAAAYWMPAFAGMTAERHATAFPRRCSRPSFCITTLRRCRGRREGRVTACTRGPRAKGIARRARDHRYRRIHSGLPCASGFTAYFVLSPVNQLVCHRHRRDAPGIAANLAPAWARQDHTTSPSASIPFVDRHHRSHRSPPRARDDRDAPLCNRGGMRQ
jgi:hypothetical protein